MATTEIYTLFFFNDTATTEIYTLSLHDALPIWSSAVRSARTKTVPAGRTSPSSASGCGEPTFHRPATSPGDRESTRLNSSHANISYAVFCLKKKNANISYAVFCLTKTTYSKTQY